MIRVLYVDDDRVNALLFSATCQLLGQDIEVETVYSGAEALEVIITWQPDLLVIDLHLPDTDGYQLLPRLRGALKLPDIPAVLCTADESWAVEAPARAVGFNGVWTKPVVLQTVLDLLGSLARQRHVPGGAA